MFELIPDSGDFKYEGKSNCKEDEDDLSLSLVKLQAINNSLKLKSIEEEDETNSE